MTKLDVGAIEALAIDVRQQLSPGLSVLDAVPFLALVRQALITKVVVRVRCHPGLARDTYAFTTFDEANDAWIWLNTEAWSEVAPGVPRTRFTLAHELGHVALHSNELDELEVKAEPDHDERLDREANRFAAHLLIPDAALKGLVRARAEDVARRFGVSVSTAARRLEER